LEQRQFRALPAQIESAGKQRFDFQVRFAAATLFLRARPAQRSLALWSGGSRARARLPIKTIPPAFRRASFSTAILSFSIDYCCNSNNPSNPSPLTL
jgi:hypothetical protein